MGMEREFELMAISQRFAYGRSAPAPFVLLSNPLTDVARAILERDAVVCAASEKLDGAAVDERDVLEVQNEVTTGSLQINESLQLCHVLGLYFAAEGEDNAPVRGSFDSYHAVTDCNGQATRKSLKTNGYLPSRRYEVRKSASFVRVKSRE